MPRRKKTDIEDAREIEDVMTSLNKTNIKLKKLDFSEKQQELLRIMFDRNTKIVFVSGPA